MADTSRQVRGQLSVPEGRALTVRAITQADIDGLDTLFGTLCEEDQYHRFFHLYNPDQKFLERMTRAEDEGGYRLVAVASGPQDALVAEAGYAILPDGDGEFTLTVAPGWQGWRLGSHLLDILVAAAAARGVPNLQADIMLDNTRMLALLSRRGYLILDRYELREARVAIAAAQPPAKAPAGGVPPQRPIISQTG
ncbi:MAG: GNAT family N-acetyltransferase [Solirubrobacterales bacterium]|nr:GNAT family N-acetyltransferase [Solirubrobacterales bacterium]